MDKPIKFTKMDEKLSTYFEEGYTIVSDITNRQGDMRTVILGGANDEVKYSVLFLRSIKIGASEVFSDIILSNQDVEIMFAYFNNK